METVPASGEGAHSVSASTVAVSVAEDPPAIDVRRRTYVTLVGVYLVALVGTLIAIVLRNDGTFTYAVDDTYIHLAIAKNLAAHGTWGVVPGAYESASSAPLWTAALGAADALLPTGARWAPLALNIGGSLWLLWNLAGLSVLDRWPRDRAIHIGVVLLPVSLGLVPLTIAGMEHVLHAAIVVQLLVLLGHMLAGTASRGAVFAFYGFIALASLVRFETAFVAAGCALAFLFAPGSPPEDGQRFHRRVRPAVSTLLASAVPIALYGLLNRELGGHLAPNSVIAKSALSNRSLLDLGEIAGRAKGDILVPAGLLLCVTLLWMGWGRHERATSGPLVAVSTTAVLFLGLGRVESFWRYQAFVIIASVYAILTYVGRANWRSLDQVARVTGVALLALVVPRLLVLAATPTSSNNIYSQQYQSGRFLAQHYDGDAVVLNDLGYVAYLHDGAVIDLAGLGSREILDARDAGDLTPERVAEIAARDDAPVAVVFETIFGPLLPDEWVRIRRWCLTGTVITNSEPCVTWFATAPDNVEGLAARLDEFEPTLPPSVEVVPVGELQP